MVLIRILDVRKNKFSKLMEANRIKKFSNVEEYLDSFPPEVKELLLKLRSAILETVPQAKESLSYGLAGYKYKGKPLAYFGGFKAHIGFYGTPESHEKFKKELASFKQGKGSVQFPFERLPLQLIREMVQYKMELIDQSE